MNLRDITEKEYADLILKRISLFLSKRNLKQSELSEKCGIGQSALSKIMNGEMKLTLHHIFKISRAFGIEPSELLSVDADIEEMIESNATTGVYESGVINERYIDDQILIRDTKHPAFKGYINNKFKFYCYPTISSESALLEGIISFEESKSNNYCKANLKLYTGKYDASNRKIVKEYHGELIISLSMSTCYVILVNSEIGEVLTLNFTHTFLFNQELVCRVCTAISTSSGGNKLPVMQRALISKHELQVNELNNEDLEFVKGQLKLNESTIIIGDETYKELLNITNSALKEFFEKCDGYFKPKTYYIVDESKIRDIDVHSNIKAQGISILRNNSTALKYNKISTKTEEFVFQYIEHKVDMNKESNI